MRFQTKLVLTMVITIAAVTFALLTATERKIRQTYTRQFEREFQRLVDQLDESRKSRSQEFLSLGSTLAREPYIVDLLQGAESSDSEAQFWENYRAALEESETNLESPLTGPPMKRGNGSFAQAGKRIGIVATMNLDGEITLLEPPSSQTNNNPGRIRGQRFNYNETGAREELELLINQDQQRTVFLPIPGKPGENAPSKSKAKAKKGESSDPAKDAGPLVQETISTPVTDPVTGKRIGLFLRGTSAETDAQRFIERYQSTLGSQETLKSGIYLDGEIYSRTLGEQFAFDLAEAVRNTLESAGPESRFRYEGEIDGLLHAVYIDALSDDPTPRPAYEVAAFPLTSLRADLAELRLRGSGIGGLVLIVGILLAYLMARNLTIPLKELAQGTEAIRAGALDHHVAVRSGDEIGELAASFNEMAQELKQKDLYRELLGKVSDETVAQALVSGSLDLELGGEIKHVSVLFCDIRGFTSLTEHMHPSDVIEMLNTHMTAMTQVVRSHLGVVDKFVGDEIMAVFGALKSYGNDAANAAACALDMIEAREKLNRELDLPIEIGVSIATGEAIAGCMGSTDRLNYTVLGSRVNLAARLCGVAKSREVVIDDNTRVALDSGAVVDPLPELDLKGFTTAQTAFRLRSFNTDSGSPTSSVAPGHPTEA